MMASTDYELELNRLLGEDTVTLLRDFVRKGDKVVRRKKWQLLRRKVLAFNCTWHGALTMSMASLEKAPVRPSRCAFAIFCFFTTSGKDGIEAIARLLAMSGVFPTVWLAWHITSASIFRHL